MAEFSNMCWMDVEEYLKKDDRIVVVIGSCEQHAYLSLATDVLEPLEIAREACKAENIAIAPSINFGLNPFFDAYPGNVSLTISTFCKLVEEVLESLVRQGFRRILVSNGHGENSSVLTILLSEMLARHEGVRMSLFQWWLHPDVDRVATDAGFRQAHANWSENHAFTQIREVPGKPKDFVILPKAAHPRQIREMLGDGCTGGHYKASSEVSQRFFKAAVKAMQEELGKF